MRAWMRDVPVRPLQAERFTVSAPGLHYWSATCVERADPLPPKQTCRPKFPRGPSEWLGSSDRDLRHDPDAAFAHPRRQSPGNRLTRSRNVLDTSTDRRNSGVRISKINIPDRKHGDDL